MASRARAPAVPRAGGPRRGPAPCGYRDARRPRGAHLPGGAPDAATPRDRRRDAHRPGARAAREGRRLSRDRRRSSRGAGESRALSARGRAAARLARSRAREAAIRRELGHRGPHPRSEVRPPRARRGPPDRGRIHRRDRQPYHQRAALRLAPRTRSRRSRHRARPCADRPRYRSRDRGGDRARDPRRGRRGPPRPRRPQPLHGNTRRRAVSRPAEKVGGIMLAARARRRVGPPKVLAPLRGQPLLPLLPDAANASSLETIVLLVADADAIIARVTPGRARRVRNPGHPSGPASSLHAGLRALAGDVDAALVMLGDVPGITPALVDALCARQRETGAAAVMSRWSERRMPPA